MASRPITVTIAGDDRQLNEVLARALAQVKTFQAGSEQAGGRMAESFSKARGAGMLLGEEIGVHMNRHLMTAMASSQLLGTALAAAFPLAAAVGFYEVLSKLGTKLGQIYYDTSGLKELQDRMEGTTKALVKFADATDHINKETAGVGASAQQKWATELDESTSKVDKQRKAVEDLSNTIYFLKNGMRGSIGGNSAADVPDLERLRSEAQAELSKSVAEQGHAKAELAKAQTEGMAQYRQEVEKSAAAAAKLRKEFESIMTVVKGMGTLERGGQYLHPSGSPQTEDYAQSHQEMLGRLAKQFEVPSNFGVSAVEPSDALAKQHIQDLQDQRGWYDATRTSAEKYAQALTSLNATFANNKDSDLYQRSLKQLNDTLDQATINANKAAEAQKRAWGQLGNEVERNIMNAAFMKESWGNALKSILEDMAQVIFKLEMMKVLSKWMKSDSDSEDGGGSGGIFGAFMSGLMGKAAGGPVSGGMSYLVGEHGPELFTPGSSGNITPNSRLGGQVINNYDFRGADPGSEMRLRMMLRMTEERAVQRSVATVQERSLRR